MLGEGCGKRIVVHGFSCGFYRLARRFGLGKGCRRKDGRGNLSVVWLQRRELELHRLCLGGVGANVADAGLFKADEVDRFDGMANGVVVAQRIVEGRFGDV